VLAISGQPLGLARSFTSSYRRIMKRETKKKDAANAGTHYEYQISYCNFERGFGIGDLFRNAWCESCVSGPRFLWHMAPPIDPRLRAPNIGSDFAQE
jgi:hypothetical protein